MLLLCHVIIRASQCPDDTIPGAIRKPARREAHTPSSADVLGYHRANDPVGGFDSVDPLLEEEGDISFASHQRQPALVFVNLSAVGHAVMRALFGFKLGNDVANARIGRQIDAAVEPDPYLGAIITSQHRPVL